MTTPTPNEMEMMKPTGKRYASVQAMMQDLGTPIEIQLHVEQLLAEENAKKDKRISTLEAALEKAEKALEDGQNITFEGGLCRANNSEMVDDALAAIREAMSPSPISPPQGAGVTGDRNGNQP